MSALVTCAPLKRGQWVHYWYSASEVLSVRFVRWVRMRMENGGEDTNKIGTGAIVSSDWQCTRLMRPRIDRYCKRGQKLLRPYWDLYPTYDDARRHQNKIQRPPPAEVAPIWRRINPKRASKKKKQKVTPPPRIYDSIGGLHQPIHA